MKWELHSCISDRCKHQCCCDPSAHTTYMHVSFYVLLLLYLWEMAKWTYIISSFYLFRLLSKLLYQQTPKSNLHQALRSASIMHYGYFCEQWLNEHISYSMHDVLDRSSTSFVIIYFLACGFSFFVQKRVHLVSNFFCLPVQVAVPASPAPPTPVQAPPGSVVWSWVSIVKPLESICLFYAHNVSFSWFIWLLTLCFCSGCSCCCTTRPGTGHRCRQGCTEAEEENTCQALTGGRGRHKHKWCM